MLQPMGIMMMSLVVGKVIITLIIDGLFQGKLSNLIIGILMKMNLSQAEADVIYQNVFRANRDVFQWIGFMLLFLVGYYAALSKTANYLKNIGDGIDNVLSNSKQPIELETELEPIAEKLNTMKMTLARKERMAQESEQRKNDLVVYLAHDLKTPLTSIIGYLGWVRTRTDLDEETRNHYIDIAYQKALRLEQLTNELFGFVKLEHKEMQLHLGKLDLVQLMEQMLDEMTPSFVKNELQVEFLHAEHAIFLEADGELLARLFGNLLNNAVKYGKEGKQIRVSMEKEGEYVVTRVINYGRIIPKQELDHIFQKFYRTEQSRSRDTGGTGLGLAIVQQIAELHHGQVRVKSDLQGTVFEVELPVGMPKGKKEDEKR